MSIQNVRDKGEMMTFSVEEKEDISNCFESLMSPNGGDKSKISNILSVSVCIIFLLKR